MCRPPDISSHVAAGDALGRAPSSNSFYGSAIDVDGEGFVNSVGEWDNPLGEDFPVQEDAAWDWPQQLQSSSNPFVRQQMTQQFDSQGVPAGNFIDSMPKFNRRPVNGSGNFQPGFGVQDKNPWKQQQQQPLHPWTGNSIPVAPPRPQFSTGMANAQIASMMAGPSLGASSEFHVAQGLPPMWNKSEPVSEAMDWMKEALNVVKPHIPARQAVQAKPATSTHNLMGQLKPWVAVENSRVDNLCQEDLSAMNDEIGSDDDEAMKDKKMRRMLSNRASAKRSRQRRQERLGELEIQTAKLRVENAALSRKYNEALEQAQQFQKESSALRAELEAARAEIGDLKLQKQACDGGSKQESGKASAHSAANGTKGRDELCHEANSLEKVSESQMSEQKTVNRAGKLVKASPVSEKSSPKSEVTGDEVMFKSVVKALPGLPALDEIGCLLGKDMEIATDEWYESLVECLDE